MSKLIFYPESDHREFMDHLPESRARARRLFEVAEIIHGMDGGKTAKYKSLAKELGLSFNGLYTPVNAFLKSGDWRVLMDRKKDSRLWVTTKLERGRPHDFEEFWRDCVESNGRSAATAYDFLMIRLDHWRRGDPNCAIPGYMTPPRNAPGKPHPKNWSLRDLRRVGPSAIELDAIRLGREAALKHAPAVLTTRKSGRPFQELQFDDMFHDIKVLEGSQLVRILEFGIMDWYSTFYFDPVLKPRINLDGVNKSLSERDFRLSAVHFLATVGWSPAGTVLQAERGLCAFRSGLDKKLEHWSDGTLTIPKPGLSGTPAVPGGYSEVAKGNPNRKALKEGRGKLYHNYLAALPGQTGMNPEHMPANSAGREAETMALLQLQGLSGVRFDFGHRSFAEVCQAIFHVVALLNDRTNHRNEGWEEEQLMTPEILVNPTLEIWMPGATVPPDYLAALAATRPDLVRYRRMSAREVIAPALATTRKLSPEAVADCIYEDTRRTVGVTAGRLEFSDASYGPGKFRYRAAYQGRDGHLKILHTDDEVQLCVNPFASDTGYLFDAKGRLLGRCSRDHDILRADVDAREKANGEKQAHYKHLVLGAQFRHGAKRAGQVDANTKALVDVIEAAALARHGLGPARLPAPAGTPASLADLIASGEPERDEPSSAAPDYDALHDLIAH